MFPLFFADDDKTKCFSAVVGCKADLTTEREVNTDKGQELAIRLGAQYYECSAKTGENVDKVFKSLASSILSHQVNILTKCIIHRVIHLVLGARLFLNY